MENKSKVPYFDLTCVKSDYPNHLIPGQKYRLRPDDKTEDGLIFCHFYFEDKQYHLIGLFPLSCFDVAPVKQWLAEYKAAQGEKNNVQFARSRQAG